MRTQDHPRKAGRGARDRGHPRVREEPARENRRARTTRSFDSCVSPSPTFALGDIVEWVDVEGIRRIGEVIEVVPPTTRPTTPGVDIRTLRDHQSYVILRGRWLHDKILSGRDIAWPRAHILRYAPEDAPWT